MTIPTAFSSLAGEWRGTNKVFLPGEPDRVSKTQATVALAAQGRALTWAYRWADGDAPQEGLLMLGLNPGTEEAIVAWVDTWHTGGGPMIFRGTLADGALEVLGSYAAPTGPDWGWRITIAPEGDASFRVQMFNIIPDGEEMLGVEAVYERG